VTVAVNKGILASILFLPSCPEGVNWKLTLNGGFTIAVRALMLPVHKVMGL
jgi:hypothetical protein